MAPYTDWADWAGDHPEQAEAELRRLNPQTWGAAIIVEECEHEAGATGHCENCGDIVSSWEPDDAQLLTQSGTKEPAA